MVDNTTSVGLEPQLEVGLFHRPLGVGGLYRRQDTPGPGPLEHVDTDHPVAAVQLVRRRMLGVAPPLHLRAQRRGSHSPLRHLPRPAAGATCDRAAAAVRGACRERRRRRGGRAAAGCARLELDPGGVGVGAGVGVQAARAPSCVRSGARPALMT